MMHYPEVNNTLELLQNKWEIKGLKLLIAFYYTS